MCNGDRVGVQVCGKGSTIGDAVVPLQSAFLDGAECLEMEGVFHSMSKIGTYSEAGGALLYVVSVPFQSLQTRAYSCVPRVEYVYSANSTDCLEIGGSYIVKEMTAAGLTCKPDIIPKREVAEPEYSSSA